MELAPLDIPRTAVVEVPASDQWIVPRRISTEQARLAGAARITGTEAGPEALAVPAPQLFLVPMFRVHVSTEGLELGIGGITTVNGRLMPTPSVSSDRRDHVHLTLARRAFPTRLLTFGEIRFDPSVLERRGTTTATKGTILEPDVSAEEAERAAIAAVAGTARDSLLALYSKRERRATTVFCFLPLYVFRYAVDDVEHHLSICGHTGAILAESAPPRSLYEKSEIVHFDPDSGTTKKGPKPDPNVKRSPEGAAPTSDAYAIAPRLTLEQARERSRKEIVDSMLRPPDIAKSKIEEPRLVHAPFWRIELTIDGFHVRIGGTGYGNGFARPRGGKRTYVTAARRMVPERATQAAKTALGVRTTKIAVNTLEPRGAVQMTGEIVEADVSREEAVRVAMDHALAEVRGASAVYSRVEPKVLSVALCHVPFWVTEYEYRGEIVLKDARFHLVLSAHDGEVVASSHPSAPRALAAKLRKALTFGRG